MMKLFSAVILVAILGQPPSPTSTDLVDQLQAILDQLRASVLVVPSSTVVVHTSAELQAALDGAVELIIVPEGTVLTGNWTLKNKATKSIIRGSAGPAFVMVPGTPYPVVKVEAVGFPKFVALNAIVPVFITQAGAHDYTFEGVEITGVAKDRNVMQFGCGACELQVSQYPSNITFDRVYVHGTDAPFGLRGLYFDVVNGTVKNSLFMSFVRQGQDSQGILINGPGPYLIENNYIEASGENMMAGGVDPKIVGMIPSDIIVRNNVFFKPQSWRPTYRSTTGVESFTWSTGATLISGYTGATKNCFELKNAQRVLITGNTFDGAWTDSQTGNCVVLTVRNQNGGATWANVRDIVFKCNVVRNMTGFAMNILATDNNFVSGVMENVEIRNNSFVGAFGIMIGYSPKRMTIADNVMASITNKFLNFYGSRTFTDFVFTGNRVLAGTYGLFGDAVGSGTIALTTFAPNSYTFTGNTIEQGSMTYPPYPAGNTITTTPGTVKASDWHCGEP